MTLGRVCWAVRTLVLVLAICASGCASVSVIKPKTYDSQRAGLFDRLERNPSSMVGGDIAKRSDENTPVVRKMGFSWPIKRAEVTSHFGRRGRAFHEGVDLKADVGTPIYASQSGRVIYSGSRIRGYGRMVVVKHERGFVTVYAHNSRLLVRYGQKVKKGQRIAISGKSGKVTGPHLHFEVRDGERAVDPLEVMAREGEAS